MRPLLMLIAFVSLAGCAAHQPARAAAPEVFTVEMRLEQHSGSGLWICSAAVVERGSGKSVLTLPRIVTRDGFDAVALADNAARDPQMSLRFEDQVVRCDVHVEDRGQKLFASRATPRIEW